MKRRDFVTSVLVGGLATPVIGDPLSGKKNQEDEHGHGHGHGDHDKSTNHTVSFGHWLPTPGVTPIDRFPPADPNPRFLNGHALIPNTSRIEVGDTVSFIISGFHLLLIYGPGSRPQDIDRTKLILSTPPPPFPPLINDPNRRVYRGLDPRPLTNQDRVEVVGFNTKGKYLVICGVLPHFFDDASGEFIMFGYIDVHDD